MKTLRYLIMFVLLSTIFYSCTPEDPKDSDLSSFNQEIFATGDDETPIDDEKDG
ncbi:MAG: hypothetical protein KAH72_00845 [Flavobacteriaceae bacterium]|nr:hypothetical protein [Flavobacteriaceae bacterium]